jgi:hypothetical protein
MHDRPNGVRWQLDNHERRLSELESFRVAVIADRLVGVENQLREVREGQASQTKIMWTIAVSLIAAALTLSVAIASGTIG